MDLTGKNVAVYGLGVSGLAAIAFLQDKGLKSLCVVDGRPPQSWGDEAHELLKPFREQHGELCQMVLQDDPSVKKLLGQQDLIILSPGIAREVSALEIALENQVPIYNELEVGYQYLQENGTPEPKVIAVTGTNGKTTCVTFLGQVLERAGYQTFVGGNIGRPLLDGLKGQNSSPYEVYLFEVSSFQCESMEKFRPQVGAILNLAANHGERYSSVEDYRQAKWLLAKAQNENDIMLVGPGVERPNFSQKSVVKDISLQSEQALKDNFDIGTMKLVGAHNRWNLGFCWLLLCEACDKQGLDHSRVKKAYAEILSDFTGVEHRLEFLGEVGPLEIYNDAKSTNWLATLTAIKAVEERNRPITLIIGGQLRGHNDEPPQEMRELLKNLSVLSIGESGQFLKEKNLGFHHCHDLNGVVSFLNEEVIKNNEERVILFSPAFPSFDQFKNYVQRGRAFKEAMAKLKS